MAGDFGGGVPVPALATEVPASGQVSGDLACLAEPPADLSEDRKTVWRRLAPHALEQGTLTTATAVGFAELTEQIVIKEALAAGIAHHGAASRDGSDALRRYVPIAQRVDHTLARFRLTAFGKAEAPPKAKAAPANPFAAVTRR